MTEQPADITLYAAIEPTGDYEIFEIKLFSDYAGSQPTKGDIQVPMGGAVLRFKKVAAQVVWPWRFHDLTIHPMGPETDRLDLKWRVSPADVVVKHEEATVKRTYSYTLSVEFAGSYFYLDPQMVDVGGGQK
ncbi:MAG: hypothetical protein GY769_18400 [bacterium]|nr:hypothetical protein [bacterium]